MATRVHEIQNPEMFVVRPDERAGDVLGYILALGITGAPVVDEAGQPIGMLSFRDLVGAPAHAVAGERMTRPALTVREESSIEEAGRLMAETGYHRLVVVDAEGRSVGVVSAIDVMRGLLGVPAVHPRAFPHFDRELGLTWTDDIALQADSVDAAPDGPGILLLLEGGKGRTERIVWGEAAHNLRTRLLDIASFPQVRMPPLAAIVARPDVRFRAASTPDFEEASRLLMIALNRRSGARGDGGRGRP